MKIHTLTFSMKLVKGVDHLSRMIPHFIAQKFHSLYNRGEILKIHFSTGPSIHQPNGIISFPKVL
jgi:hypothetical protein